MRVVCGLGELRVDDVEARKTQSCTDLGWGWKMSRPPERALLPHFLAQSNDFVRRDAGPGPKSCAPPKYVRHPAGARRIASAGKYCRCTSNRRTVCPCRPARGPCS